MKALRYISLICLAACFFLCSCHSVPKKPAKKIEQQEIRYIFFLHNRFLEEFELSDKHPEFGNVEYVEIIEKFESEGFRLFSEIRPKNTDVKLYANKIVHQIDSLFQLGVKAKNITVIGTSKGGYIAQYVSTYLKNPQVNFVFIGSVSKHDLAENREINFCGNILNIYEKSDTLGVSALQRKETSTLRITRFKEIELHTGLKHGFLYKSLDEWIVPSVNWAKRIY